MYLDRMQTAKPASEKVKQMDADQFANFFADIASARVPTSRRPMNNAIPHRC